MTTMLELLETATTVLVLLSMTVVPGGGCKGTVVDRAHSWQVTTEVTVRVLVWVTGVVMIVEPLVIVLQVTIQISICIYIVLSGCTYQGKWSW